jgi:phospholipase C
VPDDPPRLPLLAISPYSKVNFVDHHVTEQASILKFVEDNWGTGRIGDASFDARAGSLTSMFDFQHGGKSKNSAPSMQLSKKGTVEATH